MKSLKYLVFILVISFISLSNVYAEETRKVCTYNNGNYEIRCNVKEESGFGGLTCGFLNASASYVAVTYNDDGSFETTTFTNYESFSRSMSLSRRDFLNSNDEVDCNEVSTIYVDYNTLSATTSFEVYDISTTSDCEDYENVYNSNPNRYSVVDGTRGCAAYRLSTSTEEETPEVPTGGGDFSDNEENSENVLNTSTFCTGAVQGVFTTIGWIFFFAKIIIPIILIIFGSIDLGKAVVASKDDEIKKSVKTLIIRAIAGIIIFFIPTILSLIVEVIGGDDIYNEYSGTFARCTYCMFHPSECRKLVEPGEIDN